MRMVLEEPRVSSVLLSKRFKYGYIETLFMLQPWR
jgi:hypothetical protein